MTPGHRMRCAQVQVQDKGSPYGTLDKVVGYLTCLVYEHTNGRQRVRRACLVGFGLTTGFWVVPLLTRRLGCNLCVRATAACACAAVCRCYDV